MKQAIALVLMAMGFVSASAQAHGVNPLGYSDATTDQIKGNVKCYVETTYQVDYSRHVVENGAFVSSIERCYDNNGQILSERTYDSDGQKLTGTLYQYKDSVKSVSTTHDAKGERTLQTLYLFTADGVCARMRFTDAIGVTISTTEVSHGKNWSSASEYFKDGESIKKTYKYDNYGNILSIEIDGDSKSETEYTYPLLGERTKRLPSKATKKENKSKITYVFTYETDNNGNWTKRVTEVDDTPIEVAYREITYWE